MKHRETNFPQSGEFFILQRSKDYNWMIDQEHDTNLYGARDGYASEALALDFISENAREGCQYILVKKTRVLSTKKKKIELEEMPL